MFHTQLYAPGWKDYKPDRAASLWVELHRSLLPPLEFSAWWWETLGDPDDYPDPTGALAMMVATGAAYHKFDAQDVLDTDIAVSTASEEQQKKLKQGLIQRRQARKKRLDKGR